MQKLACIFSFTESNWVSCQKIVFNLHLAYKENKNVELLDFNYSSKSRKPEILSLAQQIFEAKPDTIVILDHKPHPYQLFNYLVPLYGKLKKPKIIFHIFGDFTLHYGLWSDLGTLLTGFRIEFIVASPRQKILIDKFLVNAKCKVVPFPVNEAEFYHDPNLRLAQRKSWGLKDQDFVFVFAGRLSRQKRIKTLIDLFSKEFASESSAHLFLYGDTDNIGEPFLGRPEFDGQYFRKFYRLYRSLPDSIQKRIHFMGSVSSQELLAVFNGADALVNLSVHNDEDFGMSVAEAQFTGLPGIITDWGGLANFEHEDIKKATFFVPVKIGQYSKILSRKAAAQGMRIFFNKAQEFPRKTLALSARQKFGVKSVCDLVKACLISQPDEFNGFSPLMKKATVLNLFYPHYAPYLNKVGHINKYYHEIYSAYVRPNS